MDVYKISIALAMSSNHAAVLSALSTHLLGVHARVNQLQGGFNRLKLAIGGAFAVGAGLAMLDVMEKIVDKTKDYSDELVKLQRLGGGIAAATASGDMSKRAFDIAQRVPMKVTDLLKIPGATYSLLGQEDSMKVWEPLARFQWMLQSQKDYKGDSGQDLAQLLRAGELGGRLTDPTTHKAAVEELQHFLDLSAKVMAATHGMVTPSTMLGMAQQAGFSMRGMTDEGFMNMAIASQAMGGPRAGTALLSLYNQVATGKMTKPAAIGMENIGLLGADEWKSDHGRVIISESAKSRLGKILGRDPMEFVENIYADLEKRGITDPDEQRRRVADAMSRQTSQRFTIEQMMNREQIAAERSRMNGGLGSDASFSLIQNQSVTANLEAMKNAWENLLTAVAGPNSENVISLLQSLTSAMNATTKAINETNPETLRNIGLGLGVLAAALVGAGVVALVAAIGVGGWIAAGLIALAGAAAILWPQIKSLAASEWERVAQGFNQIKTAISSFIDWLTGIYDKVKGLFVPKAADPGSKEFSDELKKNIAPMRFEPGARQSKPHQTVLNVNLNGRTLAQAISEEMDSLFRYDTNTPAFNGAGRYGV